MNALYKNLDKYRKKLGITVYAIEKGVGFSKGTITKWKDSLPSWDKLLKVANYLDVSVDYLIGNTENPKSHKNNPEDCAAAVKKLQNIITEFTNSTIDTNQKLQREITGVLSTYHIDIGKDTEK